MKPKLHELIKRITTARLLSRSRALISKSIRTCRGAFPISRLCPSGNSKKSRWLAAVLIQEVNRSQSWLSISLQRPKPYPRSQIIRRIDLAVLPDWRNFDASMTNHQLKRAKIICKFRIKLDQSNSSILIWVSNNKNLWFHLWILALKNSMKNTSRKWQ